MTAATTTPDRAEINRRNAARSTGPRSPEGKQRSRMNALKHGLSARIPVLPGEDPAAFQQRVDGFVAALDPSNALELFLVERAAIAAWKLERADRAEAAQLTSILRDATTGPDPNRRVEVAALGRWLLAAGGPEKEDAVNDLHPFLDDDRRASFRGDGGDPLYVLSRLEATADGCRWLLDRWAELRARVESSRDGHSGDLVTAILLLGQRPMGLAPHEWSNLETAEDDLDEPGLGRQIEWALLRQLDDRAPDNRAGRRAALLRVVAAAVARLTEREAAEAEREAADAADRADRLAFDAGPSGELMRRYQFGCDRALHRALNSLAKLRRAGTAAARPDHDPDTDAPTPDPDPDPAGPVAAPIDDEPSPADSPGPPSAASSDPPSAASSDPPSAASSDPPSAGIAAPTSDASAPGHDAGPQNEPSSSAGRDRIPQNEPSSSAGRDRIPQNEPSPLPSRDRIPQNEPSPLPSRDRIPQNEPRLPAVADRMRPDEATPSIDRARGRRNEASGPADSAARGPADEAAPPAEAGSRAAPGWLAVTVVLALLASPGSRSFGTMGSGVGPDPRLQMQRAAGGSHPPTGPGPSRRPAPAPERRSGDPARIRPSGRSLAPSRLDRPARSDPGPGVGLEGLAFDWRRRLLTDPIGGRSPLLQKNVLGRLLVGAGSVRRSSCKRKALENARTT